MTNFFLRRNTRTASTLVVMAVAIMAVSLTISVPRANAGVGISPMSIEFNNALRGGSFAKTLQFSNERSSTGVKTADTAEVLVFTVKAQGEIAQWVTFSAEDSATPASSFSVGLGERIQVRVGVVVPAEAANRTYSGSVFVEAIDAKLVNAKQADIGVGTAAEIPISIEVSGTERREAHVEDFFVESAEVGLSQRFTAKIRNDGNVGVAAQLDVKISKAETSVTTLSTAGRNFPILPQLDDSVYLDWDTTEQSAGSYTAEFTVTDVSGTKPLVLGTKSVSFRLEPRGTFTRAGEIMVFALKNKPELNGLVIAEAVFNNSGKIATNAVLDTQIFHDDKLVKTTQSLPRAIRPGESAPIDVTVEGLTVGRYKIVGKVNFDGEVTEEKVIEFGLSKSGLAVTGAHSSDDSGGNQRWLPVVPGFAVAAGLFGFLTRRRRWRRRVATIKLARRGT